MCDFHVVILKGRDVCLQVLVLSLSAGSSAEPE